MKFRKKPVTIEAFKVDDILYAAKNDWKSLPACVAGAYERGEILFLDGRFEVKTLEGWMNAESGNWLIQGVKLELYPCRWDIFETTYEAAE